MKTATVNGERKNITHLFSTAAVARYAHPNLKQPGLYGAAVYSVDDDESYRVLVGVSENGRTIKSTATAIHHDDYIVMQGGGKFRFLSHKEIMEKMGFTEE